MIPASNFRCLAVIIIAVTLGVLRSGGENFFLVSRIHQPRPDSYLLRLTKPEDIAHARYLVDAVAANDNTNLPFTADRAVVVAKIAKGADGLNRNYLIPGAAAWSWHVTEFEGFADYSIETLDGSPSMVEDGLDTWTRRGSIGFWGYTVVAELGIPLVLWPQVTSSGMELRWTDLGTNYSYTVEVSSLADPVDWSPAGSKSWPITVTNWIDTTFSPASPPRSYRVRAGEVQ